MHDRSTPKNKEPELALGCAFRRQVVTIAGSALIASVIPPQLARAMPYPEPNDSAPPVDGFFFVVPGKNKGGNSEEDGDRVFFISSSWLPFFELTDSLTNAFLSAPVTISSPAGYAVVRWERHGLRPKDQINFSTNGPSPITAGVPYYVRGPITDETFHISVSPTGSKLSTNTPDPNPFNNTATVDRLAGKHRISNKLKNHSKVLRDWSVLYSDDIPLVANTTAPVIPLENPRDSTYLAMSISPSL